MSENEGSEIKKIDGKKSVSYTSKNAYRRPSNSVDISTESLPTLEYSRSGLSQKIFAARIRGTGYDDEHTIKLVVDKRLEENMPIFQKMISFMIDTKLNENGFVSSGTKKSSELDQMEEERIVNSLNHLEYVTKIAYSKQDSEIRIIVIHSSNDKTDALRKIDESIRKLETGFPDHYIEPWILHESEVQPHTIKETKTIL